MSLEASSTRPERLTPAVTIVLSARVLYPEPASRMAALPAALRRKEPVSVLLEDPDRYRAAPAAPLAESVLWLTRFQLAAVKEAAVTPCRYEDSTVLVEAFWNTSASAAALVMVLRAKTFSSEV